MGSDSIVLKEVHIRMSGTTSNRNYGNLSPDVKLIFIVEGLENWSEGLQQMVNTTHEAFEYAALALVEKFDGYRDADEMLAELGIKPQTSISITTSISEPVPDPTTQVAPAYPDADSSGNGIPDEDFDEDGDEDLDDDFDDYSDFDEDE